MGMYTTCRGWIEIEGLDLTKKEADKILRKIKKLSPRGDCCWSCITFNIGFNFSPYIFIGGSIKNYDDDWNTALTFLANNFKFRDFSIQTRYEEDEEWTTIDLNELKKKEQGGK